MSNSLKRFARNGFSLVEIMLVLAILGGVAVMEIRRQAAESARLSAVTAGKQIAQLGRGVNEYLVSRRGALQRGTDPNCVATGTANVCELSPAALSSSGLMSGAWANLSPWDSPYVVRIRRVPAPAPAQAATVCAWNFPGQDRVARGCRPNDTTEWAVQALIFTRDPWTVGSAAGAAPLLDMLGRAASEAGPSAAVTNGGVARGLGQNWSAGAAEFGPGLTTGQLAYLAGSDVNAWAQFVRLDGSSKMTGHFDAGGNFVQNMNDMMLLGPESNRRMKRVSSLAPSWVFKGVYQVADGGYVPQPVCPGAGAPKIKLLFQYMADDKALFYNDAGIPPMSSTTPADLPIANSQLAANAPTYAWRIWADPSGAGWVAHFQKQFLQRDTTATATTGSGLAEVYCHYEDQQP